jgi:hypothetical protein
MMISEEQVRRAVEYLRTSDGYWEGAVLDPHALPEDLMRRVTALLASMPELRDDRIDDARVFLADQMPDSEELAAKVIGRILSDSIR